MDKATLSYIEDEHRLIDGITIWPKSDLPAYPLESIRPIDLRKRLLQAGRRDFRIRPLLQDVGAGMQNCQHRIIGEHDIIVGPCVAVGAAGNRPTFRIEVQRILDRKST